MKKLIALMFVAGLAHAGPLDMFSAKGQEGNPDTYAYLELTATGEHDRGNAFVPTYSHYGQVSKADSHGCRAALGLPFDKDITFLLSGSFANASYDYGPSGDGVLAGQNGNVKAYSFEAGFRFYLHND